MDEAGAGVVGDVIAGKQRHGSLHARLLQGVATADGGGAAAHRHHPTQALAHV